MRFRRGDRAAEGAALEMPCGRKFTAGSNPALSADDELCRLRRSEIRLLRPKRQTETLGMKGRAIATRPQQTKKTPKKPKLSRLHKPDNMSLEDWQIELRRQFGRMQKFRLRNAGEQPLFSEFAVANPESQNTY